MRWIISLREEGGFDIVVSSPFERLPLNALAGERHKTWDRVLSDQQFRDLVNDQLTHHFRVARVAALVPNSQIVLLTPDTSLASTREEFALALFVKNSLHAFTVTLGVEGERCPRCLRSTRYSSHGGRIPKSPLMIRSWQKK